MLREILGNKEAQTVSLVRNEEFVWLFAAFDSRKCVSLTWSHQHGD